MLSTLLILLDLAMNSSQTFFRKPFSTRFGGKGVYLFNAFSAVAAIAFFIVSAGRLEWDLGILPYSIGFAVSYAIATACSLLAISFGPISLTSLISASSTLLPTFYGLFFLQETVKPATFYPGLCLLMVSLFFANKPQKGEKVSLKWLFFAVMAALGNGGCMIFQTAQQVAFDNKYGNELMILSLAIVLFLFLLMTVTVDRKGAKEHLKYSWFPGLMCGVLNGANNLLVMLLRPMVGAAVLFPVITGGGLICSFLISTLFYKEKLTRVQVFGFALGIAAVVLLKI